MPSAPQAGAAGTIELDRLLALANQRAAAAERRAAEAAQRAADAARRAMDADRRASEAMRRVEEADARVAESLRIVEEVYRSTSWRVSAPVRVAGAPLRRMSSAYRDQRLSSGVKRRIKSAMRWSAVMLARHPGLRDAVIRTVDLVPPLGNRLRTLLAPGAMPADAEAAEAQPSLGIDDLSPRAQDVHRRLRSAMRSASHGSHAGSA